MTPISRGQIWRKVTPQWHGDLAPGDLIKVAKYESGPEPGRGWIWYQQSRWGKRYVLNEFSFRRIFQPFSVPMNLFLFRVELADYASEPFMAVAPQQTLEIFMQAENLSQASRDVERQFGGWEHCRYYFIRELTS